MSYSYVKLEAQGPVRAVYERKTVTNSLMKRQSFIAKLHSAEDFFLEPLWSPETGPVMAKLTWSGMMWREVFVAVNSNEHIWSEARVTDRVWTLVTS